ncbi:unnamed protein product [Dictyota dichotoma]
MNMLSIFFNCLLILIIILRNPNEQSLQENLSSLQFFESSSKAEQSLDKLLISLTFLYFVFGIFFNIQNIF